MPINWKAKGGKLLNIKLLYVKLIALNFYTKSLTIEFKFIINWITKGIIIR